MIGYHVIVGEQPRWAYAIVNHVPNNQELVDLAFALDKSFPSTRFEILDDGSRVKALGRFFEDPVNHPFPESWLKVHDFGTLNKFVTHDGVRWQLAAGDANGGLDGKILADLGA